MILCIIIIILSTPWFWNWQVPESVFQLDIQKDLNSARQTVEWQRGKTSHVPLNFLFLNWPAEFLNQRLQIIMENFSLENYFFAGHPRERLGVEEGQKFFFFQLTLFLIGLTNPNLKKYAKFLIIYTSAVLILIALFKWRSFNETLPLSLVFILIMALGLKSVFSWGRMRIPFFLLASFEIAGFWLWKINF